MFQNLDDFSMDVLWDCCKHSDLSEPGRSVIECESAYLNVYMARVELFECRILIFVINLLCFQFELVSASNAAVQRRSLVAASSYL